MDERMLILQVSEINRSEGIFQREIWKWKPKGWSNQLSIHSIDRWISSIHSSTIRIDLCSIEKREEIFRSVEQRWLCSAQHLQSLFPSSRSNTRPMKEEFSLYNSPWHISMHKFLHSKFDLWPFSLLENVIDLYSSLSEWSRKCQRFPLGRIAHRLHCSTNGFALDQLRDETVEEIFPYPTKICNDEEKKKEKESLWERRIRWTQHLIVRCQWFHRWEDNSRRGLMMKRIFSPFDNLI